MCVVGRSKPGQQARRQRPGRARDSGVDVQPFPKTSGFGEAKQTPKTKQEAHEGYTSEDSEVPRAVTSAGSNANIA